MNNKQLCFERNFHFKQYFLLQIYIEFYKYVEGFIDTLRFAE